MPLYKKSSLKAKVKTQNSFISPLISKNKLNNLIGDDYTKNIPIPTKNKLLEPLINIAKEGQLLDRLEKKSFKDKNKTVIEVTKTNETWTDAYQRPKSKDHPLHNSSRLSCDSFKRGGIDKTSSCSKPTKTKSKDLKSTLTDIRTQSPPLFDSPSSSVNSRRLKRDKSVVITTKIEITSNTDGNMFNKQKECEPSNSNTSKLLNDCVMNNIRMGQQIWNQNESAETSSQNLTDTDESINDKEEEVDERELNTSLNSVLDDIVLTNEYLSQNLFDKDDDFQMKDINKQNKKDFRKDLNTEKNKSKRRNKSVKKAKKYKENRESKKPNKAVTPDGSGQLPETTTNTVSASLKKAAEKLKQKNKSKYLTEKNTTRKTKNEGNQSGGILRNGDMFTITTQKECEPPNSNTSKLLNGYVMNNIRMSQQIWNENESAETSSQNLTNIDESIDDKQKEDDERELDASLNSILDDIVLTNEYLSQNLFDKDDDEDTNKQIKKDVRKNLNTKNNKSKKRNDLVKKLKEYKENREPKKINKAVTPDGSGQLPETTTNTVSASLKKAGEKLKQKNKSKYLIEKNTTRKKQNDDNKSGGILKKKVEKNKKKQELNNLVDDNKKNKDKKLKRKKSFTIARRSSGFFKDGFQNKDNDEKLKNKKVNGPPKASNIIFTSKDTKRIDDKINELLELQDKRNVGLYVYCDACDKVRYLPDCKDPLDLPEKWYCYMNSDQNYNKCSDPEYKIEPEEENLLIFNKFNAGSIVWAKMDGYPWWPAMVDDDPDLTDYFWLDDLNNLNSPEPSWYHVTFFDSCDVTRAWIRTASLEPFEENSTNKLFRPNKYDRYKHRVDFAIKEAKTACKKSLLERLRLYSFASRYLKKKQQTTLKDKTKTGEKKTKSKKNYNMKEFCKDLLGNSKSDGAKQHKNKSIERCDDDGEMFDGLSISSSQISTILKSGGLGGNNRICSNDNVLESIYLDQFMRNEDLA